MDEEAENGWPYRVASCKAYIYLWATSVVWRVASLSLLRKGDVADRGGGFVFGTRVGVTDRKAVKELLEGLVLLSTVKLGEMSIERDCWVVLLSVEGQWRRRLKLSMIPRVGYGRSTTVRYQQR